MLAGIVVYFVLRSRMRTRSRRVGDGSARLVEFTHGGGRLGPPPSIEDRQRQWAVTTTFGMSTISLIQVDRHARQQVGVDRVETVLASEPVVIRLTALAPRRSGRTDAVGRVTAPAGSPRRQRSGTRPADVHVLADGHAETRAIGSRSRSHNLAVAWGVPSPSIAARPGGTPAGQGRTAIGGEDHVAAVQVGGWSTAGRSPARHRSRHRTGRSARARRAGTRSARRHRALS